MAIKINSSFLLKGLEVLSWVIFIGLSIEAGGFIFNTIYALNKPIVAAHFWNGANLAELYSLDKGFFTVQLLLVILATLFKAILFYQIISMLYKNKFNFEKPFNTEVTKVVFYIAYCCLGAGFFSSWGAHYVKFMISKGIEMPTVEALRIGGGDVWLFMAVVFLVLGTVFKKGAELQLENDLTI